MDTEPTGFVIVKALLLAGTVGLVVETDPVLWGYQRSLLIAGMVGVLMGIVHRRDFTWPAVSVGALSGVSCVLYFAPFAFEMLAQFIKVGNGSAGFLYWLSGLGGYFIVGHLIKAVREPLAAVQAWWKVRRGDQP